MSSVDIQAMLNSGVKSAMRFSDLDGPHTKTIIYDHNEFIKEVMIMESSENKPPVYTQEMADKGELPPIGVDCLYSDDHDYPISYSAGCFIDSDILQVMAHKHGEICDVAVVWNTRSKLATALRSECLKPLPAKTPEELAVKKMSDHIVDWDFKSTQGGFEKTPESQADYLYRLGYRKIKVERDNIKKIIAEWDGLNHKALANRIATSLVKGGNNNG